VVRSCPHAPGAERIWNAPLLCPSAESSVSRASWRSWRAHRYGWGWHHAWFALWDGLIGMAVLAIGAWLLFHNLPPTHDFHEFVQNLPEAIRGAGHEVASWFRHLADRF
jgi:hypothetical protein